MAFKDVLPDVAASDSDVEAENSGAEMHSDEVRSEKESAD
jgi:hypothetical protein